MKHRWDEKDVNK